MPYLQYRLTMPNGTTLRIFSSQPAALFQRPPPEGLSHVRLCRPANVSEPLYFDKTDLLIRQHVINPIRLISKRLAVIAHGEQRAELLSASVGSSIPQFILEPRSFHVGTKIQLKPVTMQFIAPAGFSLDASPRMARLISRPLSGGDIYTSNGRSSVPNHLLYEDHVDSSHFWRKNRQDSWLTWKKDNSRIGVVTQDLVEYFNSASEHTFSPTADLPYYGGSIETDVVTIESGSTDLFSLIRCLLENGFDYINYLIYCCRMTPAKHENFRFDDLSRYEARKHDSHFISEVLSQKEGTEVLLRNAHEQLKTVTNEINTIVGQLSAWSMGAPANLAQIHPQLYEERRAAGAMGTAENRQTIEQRLTDLIEEQKDLKDVIPELEMNVKKANELYLFYTDPCCYCQKIEIQLSNFRAIKRLNFEREFDQNEYSRFNYLRLVLQNIDTRRTLKDKEQANAQIIEMCMRSSNPDIQGYGELLRHRRFVVDFPFTG